MRGGGVGGGAEGNLPDHVFFGKYRAITGAQLILQEKVRVPPLG